MKEFIEDTDKEDEYGIRFIVEIKEKEKYLFHALTILLDMKESNNISDLSLSWQHICNLAVEK